ncbi:MAG: DNA primase [bacterium]|nr:DNA primase [bacterium]
MNPSEEIKSKLDIVDIIREYIQLKAAGLNFRANCPFHREKTPSFMVSPEKQIWHCFGCGKGGDVFSFVMEIEGLSFVETLRQLAKKANVVLKKADPALASKRNTLLDIVELSAKYYHKVLTDSPAAEPARRYLKERGLSGETIEEWRIGYSPAGGQYLVDFLKSKNFNENEIFLAGLSIKRQDRPGFYDRFRERIIFPLNDINGSPVGFTARVMPGNEAREKMGKYINSPATMIYDKSRILFGLDKAKMTIKAEDAAVLVEGQMDAITARQNGFTNVIASSGTALTADQVNLIKRYSNNLFLSFDMDAAGDLAAERGIAVAMAAEMNIKVIQIPSGKDPDECIKTSPQEWRQAVESASPMMQYYFDKTFLKLDKSDYEGASRAVKILLPLIAKFGSKLEQDYWLKKLSQEINANENSLREQLNEIAKKQIQPAAFSKADKKADGQAVKLPVGREQMLSEMLLALALRFPAHFEYITNHLEAEDLSGADCQTLYRNLIIYYNKLIDLWTREGGNFDLAINYLDLKDWLINQENPEQPEPNRQCLNLLDRLVLLADKDFYDYSQEQAKTEIINLTSAIKINYLNSRRREIIKLIGAAEKAESGAAEKNEKLRVLMQDYQALSEEIKLMEIK